MAGQRRFDLLIKNGTVFDGTGSPPYDADIGITEDTIAAIGEFPPSSANMIYDAKSLAVSPGFIDVHSHSEFTILADPRAQGKISQGITTEINGNCGLSAAPLLGEARDRREDDLREYDIKQRWVSLSEYFRLLEERNPALNFASLVGHGNIRGSIFGYGTGSPDTGQMKDMKWLLDEAINDGALGLSTGLIYPPGIFSDTDELIGLADFLQGKPLLYTSHMRSEGDSLEEAVRETITIGRSSGLHIHISHIKTAGKENWHKAESVIAMMNEYRATDGSLTCDCYPYTASSTDLDSILPSWIFQGGNRQELERLRTPDIQKRLLSELGKQAGLREYWEGIIVSSTKSMDPAIHGKSIAQIANQWDVAPFDAVVRLLLENELRVGAIFHSMSEANKKKFLSLPYCMIGTDSSARSLQGPTRTGLPHPRGFGTFPRYLSIYIREERLCSLSEAIRRITLLPATTFGIARRGRIAEGYFADLVIFDPATVRDNATFTEPFLRSEGIFAIVVNGEAAFLDGVFTNRHAGKVLRRTCAPH